MSRLKLSLLVTLLLGAALAACVSQRGQPLAATPTASAPTAAGPGAAITATAPITLTYWEEDSDAADVLLDQLASAFMQLNPQIKVQRVHYSYNDLRDEFRAAAFRGEPPDLVRAPGEFAQALCLIQIARAHQRIVVDRRRTCQTQAIAFHRLRIAE